MLRLERVETSKRPNGYTEIKKNEIWLDETSPIGTFFEAPQVLTVSMTYASGLLIEYRRMPDPPITIPNFLAETTTY